MGRMGRTESGWAAKGGHGELESKTDDRPDECDVVIVAAGIGRPETLLRTSLQKNAVSRLWSSSVDAGPAA